MSKSQQKSTKVKERSVLTVKENRTIIVGSVIATLIAITPYLFYLYESVPETQIWDTFLFTFDAKSWEDLNYLAWVTFGKVIPLYLLIIWFFTCRHWWYHALLVPITMYVYQLFGMFDESLPYVDEFQLMHLVPVMAVIVPSIYLIRARMFNRMTNVDKSMQELEEEFKIKPKSFLEKLSDYF